MVTSTMAGQSSSDRLLAYRIGRQIGKGSYGEVYLVYDKKKKYVMKNIKLTSSAKERLGAEQEASLLSRLRHPNIVSYKESFQDEHGVLHIVMGFCEGGDLCSRLKTFGASLLPETQVVEWFVQIALGLQYLHTQNILHRDLKTQNIFLSKNNIIKVGDLGIARVLDGSCDLAHTVIGTPYYMSPELFSNQPYNHKSDIWALGCCVYEMASLKHAFTARNINALMYKILQGKVPPIPSQYSSDLVSLVQLMMAQDAEKRPSVHQILRMTFIRKHIKMFLDRAASSKKKTKSSNGGMNKAEQCKSQYTEEEPLSDEAHLDIKTQAKSSQPRPANEQSQISLLHGSQSPPPPPVLSHKVPRPLPPNPCNGVSSARQRRRKSKQLESHKMLHSHSNGKESDGVKHNVIAKAREGESHYLDADAIDSPLEVEPPSDEVKEFYTLLNSTLHLPDTEPSNDTPQPSSEKDALPSGRLADRIRAIRQECESALGAAMVEKVTDLLSHTDPEEAEEDLKTMLGVEKFEQYAAKLQQLKLCEDSLYSPR